MGAAMLAAGTGLWMNCRAPPWWRQQGPLESPPGFGVRSQALLADQWQALDPELDATPLEPSYPSRLSIAFDLPGLRSARGGGRCDACSPPPRSTTAVHHNRGPPPRSKAQEEEDAPAVRPSLSSS